MPPAKGNPPAPEPSPGHPGGSVGVVHLKGSPEAQKWLIDASKATKVSKANLVRLGLQLVAEKYGLPAPPEF